MDMNKSQRIYQSHLRRFRSHRFSPITPSYAMPLIQPRSLSTPLISSQKTPNFHPRYSSPSFNNDYHLPDLDSNLQTAHSSLPNYSPFPLNLQRPVRL